jgi:probable HAF family extracellular repeat protein
VAFNEAFRWTRDGGMVGLGDLPGGSFESSATAVSADGSVIVGYSNSAFSTLEAFRWTSGGGMVGLRDLPGGSSYSVAWGVSPDGSVIVGRGFSALGGEAFRWTSSGGMVGLGDLPGGDFDSTAQKASADGSVVGYSNSALGREPFLWTSGGGMVGLGGLLGAFYDVTGISADGSVMVGGRPSPSGLSGHSEAFRWTSDAGVVRLGDLPGEYFGNYATGVSADGSVVVGNSYPRFGSEAFIWTTGGGMQNLREFFIAGGATGLNGWRLDDARAISADGRTIVGAGTNPAGNQEAWVATIPEPNTLMLAALASFALLVTLRRPR